MPKHPQYRTSRGGYPIPAATLDKIRPIFQHRKVSREMVFRKTRAASKTGSAVILSDTEFEDCRRFFENEKPQPHHTDE